MARRPTAKATTAKRGPATKAKRNTTTKAKKGGITSADWEAAGGEAEAPAGKPIKEPAPAVKEQAEKAKGRAKKPKQMEFEGMERPKIPEVEQAAEAYEQVRDARCLLSNEERMKQSILLAAMEKHGIDFYVFDDHEVHVGVNKKVTVKRTKKTADDDPDVMDV